MKTNDNLKFGQKFTVAEFKVRTYSNRLDAKINPKTNKILLINDSGIMVGYVSDNTDLTKQVVVSEIINKTDGSIVHCMHNPGVNDAEAIASF